MEARRDAAPRLKWLWVVFVSLVPAGVSFGQEASGPSKPNLEILKLHWEKQVRLPRNFDPSIIPTGGTFSDPASRTSGSTGASSGIDATRAATGARSAAAGSNNTFPATPGRLPVFYVYALKLKNIGSKTIEGIAWDYLFIDPTSNTELGNHQFLSYAKVPANKSATLEAQLRSPPTRVVRSSDSTKNAHPKLIEKSVIQCVLYSDDTVWKNAYARDGVCELLKNNKAIIKRRAS
jgi:hypothetical protein